jgi:hypothetical protein
LHEAVHGLLPGGPLGQVEDQQVVLEELCRVTGERQDPCVLDVFIAAVRFLAGEPARPWWAYTAERKRALKSRLVTGPDECVEAAR